MKLRPSAFGRQGWYPQDPSSCKQAIQKYQQTFPHQANATWVAGIVPHAGWVYSGNLATWTFTGLSVVEPELVFLFGGHRGPGGRPICMPQGHWDTPLGAIETDEDYANALMQQFDCTSETTEDFEPDNTIELQLPLLKYFWPEARVLACSVPADSTAHHIGRFLAERAMEKETKTIAIGSTDLTHYGANYGFSPKGTGTTALRWSKEENDMPFIKHVLALDGPQAMDHAVRHRSACCPGAAAATLAYAKSRGKTEGELIAHTTSQDIDPSAHPSMWVGYASIVF